MVFHIVHACILLTIVVQDMTDIHAYSTSSGQHMVIPELTNSDRFGGIRNLQARHFVSRHVAHSHAASAGHWSLRVILISAPSQDGLHNPSALSQKYETLSHQWLLTATQQLLCSDSGLLRYKNPINRPDNTDHTELNSTGHPNQWQPAREECESNHFWLPATPCVG